PNRPIQLVGQGTGPSTDMDNKGKPVVCRIR
ncbi:hypothetical protein A2U01_0079653, partial [Trifolium medium]|nr:hypothetical protein [Trifolium medium]